MAVSLAELVTQRRTELGYTMRQLAARVGVSSAYIAHIEQGRISTPPPLVLAALARELHLSVGTLLRAIGHLHPHPESNNPGAPIKSLAPLVQQAREARGLTQAQVDQLIGGSTGYTAMIESGQITHPSQEILRNLEWVLGLSLIEILIAIGELAPSRPDVGSSDSGAPIKSLAQLVKQAREAQGLTQAQVDQAIRRLTGYTAMIESGRITHPSQETLRKLAEVLGIPREDLLVATGNLDTPNKDVGATDPVAPMTELAQLVRRAREARGLTQAQVDYAIGMSAGYTAMIESGRIARPRRETLRNMAGLLGISLEQLLWAAAEQDPPSEDL